MVGAFYRPSVEDIPTPGGYLRFNVQRVPKITLSPTSGGYATNVTLMLSKFPPNTAIAFTWDGAVLRSHGSPVTVQTDSQGNGQGVFPVPSGIRGYHTIEGSGGGASATVRFKVTPRLRVSPSGGGIGSSARISLTGYEPGETVKIRWKRPDGVYVTVPVLLSNGSTTTAPTVSSNGSGSYTIVVPAYAGPGPTTIRAAGTATTSNAAVTFTVATCAPSPTTVYAGRAISFPCAGFLPGETVDIYWKSTATSAIKTFVAGQDGSGVAAFKVPAATRGTANLIAKGRSSGRTVVSPITVTSYLRLTPASGPGGTTVSAKVYGFKAGEKICVRRIVDSTTITITCSLTADSVGSSPTFSFKVGDNDPTGVQTVTATGDQGSSATRTFNVTAQAAEPTVPATPTGTPTATPSATPTASAPPTATPMPADTATPVPTDTATPVPTDTPMPEATP
jgi:hypothetical protein